MKNIPILICISFLFGCASYTPMSELTTQALQTGDWSHVERRERIMSRRAQREGPRCESGVALCEGSYSNGNCRCVSHATTADILSGRRW